MNWRYPFGSFGRKRRDAEIDEEIASHLRMAIQDRIERGEPPEQARRAAVHELGNTTRVKEDARAVWSWTTVEQMLLDLRAATRILTRSPAFAAAAILLVALGIGGNTTIFSAIHGVLNKPMPGIDPGGLVTLETTIDGKPANPENSYPNYLHYAQATTLRSVLARGFSRFTISVGSATYAVRGAAVTPNFFETLGVDLIKGRTFTEDEAGAGSSGLAAIISYRVWQDQLDGVNDIIGLPVVVNGYPATVVGVAPAGFRGTQIVDDLQVWVPLLSFARMSGADEALHDSSQRMIFLHARLAPGVSLPEAQAEIDTISKRLEAAYPDANRGRRVVLEPYATMSAMNRQRIGFFWGILTVVGIMALLAVCANVANLMLARAHVRQREMAVRQSMGASRGRILRMLLCEGLVLSFAAWVAAFGFALWASQALFSLIPPNSQGMQVTPPDFRPDWRVAFFSLGLAVLSTLAFTVAPALRAWRQQLLPWLKAGEHSVAQGRSGLSRVLVVVQIAFCVVLLTASGLAYRSLFLIESIDLHFNKDQLLLTTVSTKSSAATAEENLLLLERVRQRLLAAPGVVSVSHMGLPPPFSWSNQPVRALGSAEPVPANANFVGPGYLETLGITPLGRDFTEADRRGAPKTALINQYLAEALWPGESALGRMILFAEDPEPREIVGVMPNAALGRLQEESANVLLLPELQRTTSPGETTFCVRYEGGFEAIAPIVRAAVADTDARLPITYQRTMEVQLANRTGPIVLVTTLVSLFGVGSLFLAAIGLYAVVAFNMARRTRDFGVRVALGASSHQILGGVLGEGLLLTSVGLLLGFSLSLASATALRGLLFGITPTDTPTYLGVFCSLTIVSLLACYLPARRAARIDPVRALRQE